MSKRKTTQSNSNKQKVAKLDASASTFEAAQKALLNLKSTIGTEIKDATTLITKQKDEKIQELRDKHALIKSNHVTDLAESTSAITAKYKDALSAAASNVAVAKDHYYQSCTGCNTSCDPKELASCPNDCSPDLKCSSCRTNWPSCGNYCSSCQPDRDVVENAPKPGEKQKKSTKKKSKKQAKKKKVTKQFFVGVYTGEHICASCGKINCGCGTCTKKESTFEACAGWENGCGKQFCVDCHLSVPSGCCGQFCSDCEESLRKCFGCNEKYCEEDCEQNQWGCCDVCGETFCSNKCSLSRFENESGRTIACCEECKNDPHGCFDY
jgi:hypothetical protein